MLLLFQLSGEGNDGSTQAFIEPLVLCSMCSLYIPMEYIFVVADMNFVATQLIKF